MTVLPFADDVWGLTTDGRAHANSNATAVAADANGPARAASERDE